MTEAQIWQHRGIRNKTVCMKKTQRRGLHRAADKQRLFFDRVRQIGHDHLACFVSRGAIQDKPERSIDVVFADDEDGVLEERSLTVRRYPAATGL